MVSGGALGDRSLENSGWSTNLTIGSAAASPWLRARIARVGLLALTREETIYFDRATDNRGAPLRADCVYRLEGQALPARWWSVTLYDSREMLADNTDSAHSVDTTRTAGTADGAWSAVIASKRPEGTAHWLSSRNAANFGLTLRLYNPVSVAPDALAAIALPAITRVSCPAGAS